MGFLDAIAPGKKNRAAANASTQVHLRFGEIRDNTLVLKNGGLRSILKTSSINFNLKSEQEQQAIIHGYQGFLNSIEFPIQILIKSKKLDIDDYIDQVKELGEKQENKLLQDQTYEYAEYIRRLVEYADIMEKEFYVVIPFDPMRSQGTGPAGIIQSFLARLSPKDSYGDVKKRHDEFNNLRKGLTQRVNIVKAGLENCGLKAEEIETQEIIELLYNSYNPTICRTSKLKDLDNTDIEKGKTEETEEEEKSEQEDEKEE